MFPVLEVFTVSPFDENTYLVGDADAGEAVVVDPGGRVPDIVRAAERHGLRITDILNTHAHIDHVTGVAELQAATDAPFWLHRDAEPLLQALPQQAAMFGLPPVAPPAVDRVLTPGRPMAVGGLDIAVRDTPGHAPGHVTFVLPRAAWPDGDHPVALCGDVIFYGSIGRTDLPGGDYETLMTSIEREILTLDDETVLLSGHGPATTVGRERRSNPFVVDWMRRPRDG